MPSSLPNSAPGARQARNSPAIALPRAAGGCKEADRQPPWSASAPKNRVGTMRLVSLSEVLPGKASKAAETPGKKEGMQEALSAPLKVSVGRAPWRQATDRRLLRFAAALRVTPLRSARKGRYCPPRRGPLRFAQASPAPRCAGGAANLDQEGAGTPRRKHDW